MSDIQYVTKEGYEALVNELKHLKSVRRPEISKAIAEAREKGDLSENAEYHAAREELALLEAKISEMEGKVGSARVMDESKVDISKVGILTKVDVMNNKLGKKQTFTIVSEAEANLKEGKISITSPIGKALIGKKIGEKAVAQTPAGAMEFEVLSIGL
ncbi:MAG: transcription elongation factor GreA [Bacteroidetes bacterium]|nr:transcription elongation factor GreA [Bacteroidota bacterium]MBS1685939.1 transcription elongation factor GreA [Bacteroidota bacterium]